LLRESGGGQAADPEVAAAEALEIDEEPAPEFKKGTMPRTPAIPTQPGIDVDAVHTGHSKPSVSVESDEDVDLYTEAKRPPSITDSGTLEISQEAMDQSQKRAEQLESSSIDMNSRPSLSEFEMEIPSAAQPTFGSNPDVDFAQPRLQDESGSSLIHRRPVEINEEALAAHFRARKQAREKARRAGQQSDIVPSREDEVPAARRRGYLLHGGVLGLLLGAGAVLAAYFGGALPDRKAEASAPVADNSGALAQARKQADAAKKEADEAKAAVEAVKKSLTDAGIDPEKPADSLKHLADAKTASETQIKALQSDVTKAKADVTAARKEATDAKSAEDAAKNALADAEKSATEAKKQLTDATKSIEVAKAETLAAMKKADEALKLVDATDKDAKTKLAEAAKRETDLAKANEAARKSAEDAVKARDAHATILTAIGERLAKAKFVGDKADGAAIVKGLDDAIKAASNDATTSLRDELVKARAQEAKLKSDLAAAMAKEAEASKTVTALRADMQKLTTEAAKSKADADKFSKEAADALSKATAAEKTAIQEKTNAERLAAESSRLKIDNDRLTRDIAAVRELADLIRQGGSTGSSSKPDPSKLADRFFSDGLRSFHAGEYTGAQSSFRKALQFRPDDARYHYLLGLSLWMADDRKAAEAEFEKGRDLEMDARPPSRAISSVLERIQGPARQAVNAYRP
jgi:chromosome segregation ATPase